MNKRLTAGLTAAVYFTMSSVTPILAEVDTGPVSKTNESATIERSVDTKEPVGVSVTVNNEGDGKISVEVTGNVNVDNSDPSADAVTGISVNDSRSDVYKSDDVEVFVDGNDDSGVSVKIQSSGEKTETTGISASNTGVDAVQVYTGGVEVSSSSSGITTGVNIIADDKGYTSVLPDSVKVSGSGSGLTVGASINSGYGGASNLRVFGDVDVKNDQADVIGIAQTAVDTESDYFNDPYSDATVLGNVTATSSAGDATGIRITSVESDPSSAAGIYGDVTATTTDGVATGLDMTTKNGSALAEVGRDLSATSTNGLAIGLDMDAVGGGISADVTGKITADGNEAIAVRAVMDGTDSTTLLLNEGGIYAFGDEDATGIVIQNNLKSDVLESDSTITIETSKLVSDGTGILDLNTLSGTTTDILVDGLLYADKGPAVAIVSDSGADLNLTVWKIESGTDSLVAEKTSKGYESTDAAKTIEKSINYILKVDPDWTSAVSFDSANQKTSTNEDIYYTGKEGEKIAVKLSIPEGYYVASAYSDVDQKVSLRRDLSGEYYLFVPKGGGVMVSLNLAPITYNGDDGDDGGNPPTSGTIEAASASSIISDGAGSSFSFAEGQTSVSFSTEELRSLLSAENGDMTFQTSAGQFVITASDLSELLAKYGTLRFAIRNGRLAIFADNGYTPVMTLDPAGAAV